MSSVILEMADLGFGGFLSRVGVGVIFRDATKRYWNTKSNLFQFLKWLEKKQSTCLNDKKTRIYIIILKFWICG